MYKSFLIALGLFTLNPIPVSKQTFEYKEPLVVKLASKEIPFSNVKKEEIEDKRRIYIPVELTAYDDDYACTQNIKNKGITASGVRASRGTLAVPKVIPLGSDIYINGVPHRAEDRGGAIKVKPDGTYVIDVYVKTHKEALEFGRVKARMYIENNKYYIEY